MSHEILLATALTIEEALRTLNSDNTNANYIRLLLDAAREGVVEVDLLRAAVMEGQASLNAASPIAT
jgi:hypothetical protein